MWFPQGKLVKTIDWGSHVNDTMLGIEVSANKDGNPIAKNFKALREEKLSMKEVESKKSEAANALDTQMSYKDNRIFPESEAQKLASRNSSSSYRGLFSNVFVPKSEQIDMENVITDVSSVPSKTSKVNTIEGIKKSVTIETSMPCLSVSLVCPLGPRPLDPPLGPSPAPLLDSPLDLLGPPLDPPVGLGPNPLSVSLVCSPSSSPGRQDIDIHDDHDRSRNSRKSQSRRLSSPQNNAKIIEVLNENFDPIYLKYIAAGGPPLNYHTVLEKVWIRQEDYHKVLYYHDADRMLNHEKREGGHQMDGVPKRGRDWYEQSDNGLKRGRDYNEQSGDGTVRDYKVNRYDDNRARNDRGMKYDYEARDRSRGGMNYDRSSKDVVLNHDSGPPQIHGGNSSSSNGIDQFGREIVVGEENANIRNPSREGRRDETIDTRVPGCHLVKFCHWGIHCTSGSCKLRHDGADNKKIRESKPLLTRQYNGNRDDVAVADNLRHDEADNRKIQESKPSFSKRCNDGRDVVNVAVNKPLGSNLPQGKPKFGAKRCHFGYKCTRRNDNPPCRWVHPDEVSDK
jgi:hypothetical protein